MQGRDENLESLVGKTFPSIFSKIKSKPNKDYADNLIHRNFIISKISYRNKKVMEQRERFPENDFVMDEIYLKDKKVGK